MKKRKNTRIVAALTAFEAFETSIFHVIVKTVLQKRVRRDAARFAVFADHFRVRPFLRTADLMDYFLHCATEFL